MPNPMRSPDHRAGLGGARRSWIQGSAVSGGYRYAVEYFRDNDGTSLGAVPIEVDWGPALEWAHFSGVRRGTLEAVSSPRGGSIEPLWDPSRGQPMVRALRAVASTSGGSGEVACEIPFSYFHDLALRGSDRLLAEGLLKRGEAFRYAVCAFAVDARLSPVSVTEAQGLQIEFEDLEERPQELALEVRPLEAYSERSMACGGKSAPADIPVFIPQQVTEEALELCQSANGLETGGVFVGYLRRAAEGNEVFVEVSAQIPAVHTESKTTRLTFTPETWSAVRAAMELRGQCELMVGWWHYHPNWCAGCPPERAERCPISSDFFSFDDRHLHRTCFPRAYQMAMLFSDHSGSGMNASLFAWRQGTLVSRGFHVLAGDAPGLGDSGVGDRTGGVTSDDHRGKEPVTAPGPSDTNAGQGGQHVTT